ncbi:hypothetical protein WLQ65_03880 [Pseudoalteromonas piscicida]|uniref:hypothetical protein n=1 Tax=Pseudoalteromonas TaxID=53246 RepID=UPI0021ADACBB|nr:hypothetical protein [Pseudoalteromonas flavipulchra]USE71510.1 hypothetical protein CTT31_20710 [Pseudoalteromonas flavipulchra]
MIKKNLLAVALICGLSTTAAYSLEPLKERARVQRMNADLLLPDGSILNVDVSFDCGSDYQNTAIMVMSDSGAQLMAAAYTYLFGERAGKSVIQAWENKQNKSDPRKPTYLFILAPREQQFNLENKITNKFNKELSHVIMSSSNLTKSEVESIPEIPMVIAGCGVRNHNPVVIQ